MKDKIAFVIAFLGVFIAITPFKDTLIRVQLDYGLFVTDLYSVLYIPLGLLFLAAYVYAIDYTKYGFKIFDGWSIFRYFENIANTLYLLAIFSPILILFTFLIVQLFSLIPFQDIKLEIISYIANIIAVLTTIIYSIKATIRLRKDTKEAKEETLENTAYNVEQEAKRLFEQKKWNLTILESYRLLEIAINKKLIDFGIDAKRLPAIRALDLLLKNGVITKDDFHKINFVRSLRNEAAHSNPNYTQEDVEKIFNITNEIIPKLKRMHTTGENFERTIYEAMTGENGFFPKHHLMFPQNIRDVGYDLLGDGPKYTYLIEIKMSNSVSAIKRALHQLERHSTENNRSIIVVPDTPNKMNIGSDRVRILYYDMEKNVFTNRDEIYNWIYNV